MICDVLRPYRFFLLILFGALGAAGLGQANTLGAIDAFIRAHDGEILVGSPVQPDEEQTAFVFSVGHSMVWRVDPESGDLIDQGAIQLDRATSRVIFACEVEGPIEWTPDALMAMLLGWAWYRGKRVWPLRRLRRIVFPAAPPAILALFLTWGGEVVLLG